MKNIAKIEIPNMGTWVIDVSDRIKSTPFCLSHYRDGHLDIRPEYYKTFESCFHALSQQIRECVLKDVRIEINPLFLF